MAPPTLNALLKSMVEQGGSDLHITTNSPPQIRVDGRVLPLNVPPLNYIDTMQILTCLLTDRQKDELNESGLVVYSLGVKGLSRFRASVYYQQGTLSGTFTAKPYEIRTFRDLGLPVVIERCAEMDSGLCLIGGPRRSGKSTTLAAIVDKINRERHAKIVVIDRGESFLHQHQNCLVDQVRVGRDISSIDEAMGTVLGAEADVVALSGIYDRDGLEQILQIAQSGYLVLATALGDGVESVLRNFIQSFPPHHQSAVRYQLGNSLKLVLAQELLPRADGRGRALAMEILPGSRELANLISTNQLGGIDAYLADKKVVDRMGGQAMNQSLADLHFKRKITLQLALTISRNAEELQELISRGPAELRPLRPLRPRRPARR